jgi:hypothetical protein
MPKRTRCPEQKEAIKLTETITKKLFKGFVASDELTLPSQEAYENIKDLSELHTILYRLIQRRNLYYVNENTLT